MDTNVGLSQQGIVDARRRATLPLLLTGQFMAALDVAITNVAAPQIRSDLHVSGVELVLIISGYALTYAMALITGARLGHDYGARRLFLVGLAGFTLASLACGLAVGGWFLLFGRFVQGVFGAMMVPQVNAIILWEFEGDNRARALGYSATVLAFGAVVGQILGGALVTILSWRWVFLVNVPIGVALFVGVLFVLRPDESRGRRQLDVPGVAISSSAVFLIVLPLVIGEQEGWPVWTFLALGGGLALLTASIAHWKRIASMGDPLIHPSTFASKDVKVGFASLFVSTVAYGGFLFTLGLYLQTALSKSAVVSGLMFVPYGAAFALVSITHTSLRPRIRRHLPASGAVFMALGYAGLVLATHSHNWQPAIGSLLLAVAGAGYAACFSPLIARTAMHIPHERAHDTSGLISMTIQLGFVAGAAIIGSYYLAHAHSGEIRSASGIYGHVGLILGVVSLAAGVLAALVRPALPKP